MDEEAGCMFGLVFLGTWGACTLAFGPLGFLLGWAPALILGAIWPLLIALGAIALIVVLLLGGALFLWVYYS